MIAFTVSIVLLVLNGAVAVVFRDRSGLAQTVGQTGAISGSAFGLAAAIRVFVTGEAEAMSGSWHMPGGCLHFELDALSAFFLLPVGLWSLDPDRALYGRSYLAGRGGPDGSADSGRAAGLSQHDSDSAELRSPRRLASIAAPGGTDRFAAIYCKAIRAGTAAPATRQTFTITSLSRGPGSAW